MAECAWRPAPSTRHWTGSPPRATWRRQWETVAGRVRRTYGLTESGSAALRAEAQRMAEAAALVIAPERRPAPGQEAEDSVNMELHIPPSRLERRIRLLLRAYPPGYRADRGEEMLATLLEATPDGRDWPSARDSWSLLAGGTRARRTSNQRLGPATSLRQAVVLGLALYVSYASAQFLLPDPLTRAHGTPMLAGSLLAATALAVLGRPPDVPITTVAASLAVLAYYWYVLSRLPQWTADDLMSAVPLLLAMLALVPLTRRDGRPPRSWLILALREPLALLVTRTMPVLLRPGPAPDVLWNLPSNVYLLLAIPALAWLVTDARPALGVALARVVSQAVPVATVVQAGIAAHQPVTNVWQGDSMGVEELALAVAMTVALAWMLRQQTRPPR